MTSAEAREALILHLQTTKKSDNYKFILEFNSEYHMVELTVRKLTGLKIGEFLLFRHWKLVRVISGDDYIDILEKIQKYPKYLETEYKL